MTIGLALSGGGAKGLAHIGVIKALNDFGIHIDYISGTSSGSIIAALFSAGYTPNEIIDLVNKNRFNIVDIENKSGLKILNSLMSKKVSINGFVKGNNLEYILKQKLLDKNIKDICDIKLPIAIPAVNLFTGDTVYFTNMYIKENEIEKDIGNDIYVNEGNLASIIRASISVPGIFKPKKINNCYYIDGGVKVNTPVNILKKMGADKIIAVTFIDNNKFGINNVYGIPDTTLNKIYNSNSDDVGKSDVNICLNINNVSLFDTSKSVYLANRGYNIVINNINKIKEILEINGI